MNKSTFVLLVFMVSSGVIADSSIEPTGVGVADWGMERQAIMAAEDGMGMVLPNPGAPLLYPSSEFLGKKAEILYEFQDGCTKLKSSTCLFSHGSYSFKDPSKSFFDEVEKQLTKKYGPPDDIEEDTIEHSGELVDEGKHVSQVERYIRQVGRVEIRHVFSVNKHRYVQFDKEHPPGPGLHSLTYKGPYFYKQKQLRKKAKERGL